jgi:PAS domain S-box-containing protein
MTETALTRRERRLAVELHRLQALLDEPLQTLEAIRSGQVDAFVVSEMDEDDRVFVLKSADRLHRLIVESMGEGAVTLTHDGAITYANPHFLRILGIGRDELLGLPLRNFVSDDTRDVFDELLRTSVAAMRRGEVAVQTTAGDVPVSISSTPLVDTDGSYFCLIVSDLREERDRDQLRAAKDAAEVANRSKDDFLAMVSHELRSPITVILGWTRMLQMNRVDRDTLNLAVNSIHHSTARLLKLVDDILDASRLSSGKLALQIEVADFRDIVRRSLESVRFEVEQKPLVVVTNMPDEPVLILGDPDRLQQVVVNLLTNAAKFTPPHGHIHVDLETVDGMAQLSVIDSGEGIDPGFIEFVFERFRQDDGSTTRSHKGLGLGLSIVKQLVEAHGGSVSAHSDGKGHGAKFTVTLPATLEAQALVPDAVESEEPLPSLEGVRVLLVDDEPDTIDVMSSILRSSKAQVETATSVGEALERAAASEPHVIVSDIAMPGEDGFEFLRRLAPRSSIPVLAISGKGTREERDAILAAGFQQYLRKPIEPETLIRAVDALARG